MAEAKRQPKIEVATPDRTATSLARAFASKMASEPERVWDYEEIASELEVSIDSYGRPSGLGMVHLRRFLEDEHDTYLFPVRGIGFRLTREREKADYVHHGCVKRAANALAKSVRVVSKIDPSKLDEMTRAKLEHRNRMVAHMILAQTSHALSDGKAGQG